MIRHIAFEKDKDKKEKNIIYSTCKTIDPNIDDKMAQIWQKAADD